MRLNLTDRYINWGREGICGWCRAGLDEPAARKTMYFVTNDEPDAPTEPGKIFHHLCTIEAGRYVYVELVANNIPEDSSFLLHQAGRQLLKDLLERCLVELDDYSKRVPIIDGVDVEFPVRTR